MSLKTPVSDIQRRGHSTSRTLPSLSRTSRYLLFLVTLVGIAAGAIWGVTLAFRRHEITPSENQSILEKKDERHAEAVTNEEVAEFVSRIADVPSGEFPTIATVSDKSKLEQEPFFQRAENGDKVLFYSEEGRAILFRPSVRKIIDMTTVKPALSDPGNVPEKKE